MGFRYRELNGDYWRNGNDYWKSLEFPEDISAGIIPTAQLMYFLFGDET